MVTIERKELIKRIRLGVITKLYRYWDNKNVYKNEFFEIDYQYQVCESSYDNTSRQQGVIFGNKKNLIERMESILKKIK